MEMIAAGAGVAYRTRCLELETAARFARCLSANSRFCGVEIRESSRAKSEARWFVSYLPTNIERVGDMLRRQQDSRAARAEAQGFTFVEDRDSRQPFCWCHSHSSGETYETTLFNCSCPDYRWRLSGTGIACKHMVALSAAINAGEVQTW